MKKNKPLTNEKLEESTKQSSNYFDIIAILFVFLILIIDFLPTFSSTEIIAPQFLYFSILNCFAAIFFYKNKELFTGQFITFLKKSNIFKIYILFILLCSISVFSARNFSLFVIKFTEIITVLCLFFNLSIFLSNRLHLVYKIALMIGISVFIQSYLSLSNFIEIAKSKTILEGLATIKSNTGNINIFAASLTGKLSFLILGITYFTKWKKWFLVITLFLATLLVILTGARASFIALFVELLIFSILFFKINSEKKATLITLSYIIIPFIVSYFAANLIFGQVKSDRYRSISNRISQITVAPTSDGSANLRLIFWNNALHVIKEQPLLGIGLGNWQVESVPLERTTANDLILSVHPHNDFLEIAAETGILNGIVYLILFGICFAVNIKRVFKNEDYQSRVIAIIALLLIITYGIDALFNFPLYRPTMQINFCLLLVLTIFNTYKTENSSPFSYYKIGTLSLLLISFITLYFSYCCVKAYQLENDMRLDSLNTEDNLKLSVKEIQDRLPNFPNVATNAQPFVELLGIYNIYIKNYKEAHKYLNQSIKINPYTARGEWYKYRIAKETGKNDSALIYAKQAFEIRPRTQSNFEIVLLAAKKNNDTLTMIKYLNEYNRYRKEPVNWLKTASVLASSNYPYKKLIALMDNGLKEFPNDSTLMKQKKLFENDLTRNAKSFKVDNNKVDILKMNELIKNAEKLAADSKFEKAIEVFKKVLQQTPTNTVIIQNIGICYFKLNQFKSAIIYLEKTLNSPTLNDGKSEYILGVSNLNTNNKEKGCYYLNISKSKNYPEAKRIQDQYCK